MVERKKGFFARFMQEAREGFARGLAGGDLPQDPEDAPVESPAHAGGREISDPDWAELAHAVDVNMMALSDLMDAVAPLMEKHVEFEDLSELTVEQLKVFFPLLLATHTQAVRFYEMAAVALNKASDLELVAFREGGQSPDPGEARGPGEARSPGSCSSCGAQLVVEANYCPMCGAPVGQAHASCGGRKAAPGRRLSNPCRSGSLR